MATTESKHTPGPWEYRDVGIYSTVAKTDWADPEEPSERDFVCVVSLYSAMGGNAEADVRLIASAPDLLEALRASRDAVQYAHDNHPFGFTPTGDPDDGEPALQAILDEIDAALSKALPSDTKDA